MDYKDIFNTKTVNIFCDGSIKVNDITGETIGSPGYCVVTVNEYNQEVILEQYSCIIRDCTNNITENRALLLSVQRAIYYYSLGYDVNIFSDSQYCIHGITDWIFKWIQNVYNNHMYNSSGEIVKNEDFILELFMTIYRSGVKVNFYHQKGHVTDTPSSLDKAVKCFSNSNNIRLVEPYFVKRISYYNNMVDIFTKNSLDIFASNEAALYNSVFRRSDYIIPATFGVPTDVDMGKYKEQMKRRKRYV